jgi:Glycosyltransferase family 87
VLVLVAVCTAAAWPADSTLVPRNGGHPVGDEAWARLFLACAAGAFVAYAAGLALLRRSPPRLAAVAVLAAAVQLAPLASPLLLSTDAWAYWDYGSIAAQEGGNPYRDTPSDFPHNAAYEFVGSNWRDDTSVYGPAFTLASEPLALAAGASADAAAWIYKMLAALAVLGITVLVVQLAREKAFACAFVGWNPLLALHFAGGGHNDAWMVLLVAAALTLAAHGRRQSAGACWAAAALVKWVSLLFLPLRALEARARGRPVGHAGFALAAAAIATLAFWRYGAGWLGAFGPLARNANDETSYALPHRLEQLGVPDTGALAAAVLAFAVGYAWLALQAARGRARLGLAACFLLLATPYLAPWYAVWAVPLAAADDDRAAQWLSLAIVAYLVPQTVPI